MSNLDNVKTGDILAWKRNRNNKISNLLIKFICFLSGETFGHVGIALRVGKHLYVFEASYPSVKLTKLDIREQVYHIPMGIEPNQESLDFLYDVYGLDYSIMDGIRSVQGKVSHRDDKWQCAELVLAFLDANNIVLEILDIPGQIVEELTKNQHRPIHLLY